MTLSNPWFLFAVLGVVSLYHVELLASLLNLAQFRKPLPGPLQTLYDDAQLERCQDYHRQSTQLDITRDTVMLIALLVFWWSGGFRWLNNFANAFGSGAVITGTCTIAALGLIQALLSLPFSIWQTFRIESAFGFNRTSAGTFIADQFKSLALVTLLGLPLLALILWFFDSQRWAAAFAWIALAAFSLLMIWASPRFIMPLFLTFKPLAEGPLKQAILDLTTRLRFPVAEVSVVDGSRRSTKANAFFAGFGRNKRIALYDTLVQSHTQEELLAVLAHEIGHSKCRHVPKHLVISLAETAILFAALHFALHSAGLYAAFGVAGQPLGLGVVFFSILFKPASLLLSLLSSWLSRKHEFEADAFACNALGSASPLASALQKLSTDHLAHPQPHPLTVRLHYSHPPLNQRLAAMQAAA